MAWASGTTWQTTSGTSAELRGDPQRASASARSLLLIDCGSAFTKVALVGLVDGRHRLLSRAQAATTAAAPYPDVTRALLEACAELERATGYRLLHEGRVISPGRDDGAGVDAIVLSTSVGGPLRLLTTGPGREALASLLQRAIGGLFVQPEVLPPTPENASERDTSWAQMVEQVRSLHPHAVLVVGAPPVGSRNGTLEQAAKSVARWLDVLRQPADDGTKPLSLPVIFAGSTDDGVTLAAAVRGSAPRVHPVEGLSPATLAPLAGAVSAIYENAVLRETPGFAKVRAVTAAAPLAAATSLGASIRILAGRHRMTIVGVDVGASSTVLAASNAQGEFLPASFPLGGVGAGAGYVLRAAGAPNILRWLTLPADENTVREHALTRMLRPRAIPATPLELELEYAFAREALRLAQHAPGARLAGLSPIDVILGAGGVLTSAPHPGLAALILLDALQPRGITSLALDCAGLVTMLGASGLSAELAADLTESDAVSQVLGPVVSVAGAPATGSESVRVSLEYADGRKHVDEVPFGSLARLPLGPGERALLSLYPSATLDVGLGPGQQARASEPLEGGVLGVVVDARGRPLALPTDPTERKARLTSWKRTLGIPDAVSSGASATAGERGRA